MRDTLVTGGSGQVGPALMTCAASSRLDCARMASLYAIAPRPWTAAVVEIIDELIPSRAS